MTLHQKSINLPIILVDGSSYLYRAFHAMPALMNSKGFPTGAIYGVVNMMKKLLHDYPNHPVAMIFDPPGKTFRDDLYPDYKATRKAMPNELVQQIEPLFAIIKALGIPLILVPGVEADDVIGTLAKNAVLDQQSVIISTGDKDMAQLVSSEIHLINTMTNTTLDRENVKAKFDVYPEQIVDYLTLVGDTSDNIPGVPKVGPKTAAKWLNEYGTLDNIIQHQDAIGGKVGENLKHFIPNIPLTKTLVTIKTDLPLPLQWHDIHLAKANHQALIQHYQELEFKSWLAELLTQETPSVANVKSAYETIQTKEVFTDWINKLKQSKLFAFDTETTSLNAMDAEIVGVSFAVSSDKAAYIPLMHRNTASPQLDQSEVLQTLKPLLEDPALIKITQNGKYDLTVLKQAGITLNGLQHDTMLASYVLDSSSNQHDMDSLALKYLGHKTITYEDVAGKGSKQIPFAEVSIEKASEYAAEDAAVTFGLYQALLPKIENEPPLKRVYETIEIPLIPVLASMEQYGVLVDANHLSEQGILFKKRLAEIEKEIHSHANQPFNIQSPKQLQAILFDELKLPILQKTPTGQPSTADAVLQELALDFALPKLIIEYRSLSKLITTYTDKLIQQINPRTKRIHTSYNQTVAATGRLSSSDPNLQNIPIRTPEGRKIREAFIAPTSYQLISADYSQIELRLMAHISEDANLINAFLSKQDIHKATAAEVWGVSLEDVTFEMRRHAKAINFGIIYGMSAFGLAKQIGVDRHAAQAYIDKYFNRYPNVKAYMENTREKAKKLGYVETLYGRRLYLPEIKSSQMQRQRAAERAAINAPLQGSAADLIKLAMIQLHAHLPQTNLRAKMILQVHDELVFEVHEADIADTITLIRSHMENIIQLHVPIEVHVGQGNNWNQASEH